MQWTVRTVLNIFIFRSLVLEEPAKNNCQIPTLLSGWRRRRRRVHKVFSLSPPPLLFFHFLASAPRRSNYLIFQYLARPWKIPNTLNSSKTYAFPFSFSGESFAPRIRTDGQGQGRQTEKKERRTLSSPSSFPVTRFPPFSSKERGRRKRQGKRKEKRKEERRDRNGTRFFVGLKIAHFHFWRQFSWSAFVGIMQVHIAFQINVWYGNGWFLAHVRQGPPSPPSQPKVLPFLLFLYSGTNIFCLFFFLFLVSCSSSPHLSL